MQTAHFISRSAVFSSTGTITWTSSNPDIASVDDSGVVYHGTQTGTATITCTVDGQALTCIVRCNF